MPAAVFQTRITDAEFSMHADQILGLTVLVLRISGAAGLIGAVMALAIDYLGANRVDIQATTLQVASPNASSRGRDRLDTAENYAAKGHLLLEVLPEVRP
jgi:hypothetical protein